MHAARWLVGGSLEYRARRKMRVPIHMTGGKARWLT
jgi:hypothetical protein